MSLINFTKSQGLGNDFIVIEDLDGRLDIPSSLVQALCDRHFGIGADGLITVNRSETADYFMNYRNSDGSQAEMCGNGIRVFAKYIHDHLRQENTFRIETPAGIKNVELRSEMGGVTAVSVDMGEPDLAAANIPVAVALDRFVGQPLAVNNTEYRATCVSMGNPHCVIFVDDVKRARVEKDGSLIETMPLFPEKTNVEFVEVRGRDILRIRVWERGVGETLACGTGACAAVVAAGVNELTGRNVLVQLPGGDLRINWLEDNAIRMTGPAAEVFTGQFDFAKWI
jgi:diaminopimelate epimerase